MEAHQIQALAVDDDPAILSLLQVFLRSRGYAVHAAADGEEAWELICRQRIDLLVVDWNMPRLDGIGLCRRLRERRADHYTYVVMLTAKPEASALQEAMLAGVDDFLNKPFRSPELAARLHAADRVLGLHEDLALRNQRLEQAYAQLSSELELAREMQLRLLPAPCCLDRVCFDWLFEASHYVGGDIFHYFPVDDERVCFYLIDVAGHGVPAALLAFHAQHEILNSRAGIARAIAASNGELGAACSTVVAEINRRFLALNHENHYFTMVFGLLDARRGELALVQAGHPSPFYLEAGDSRLRQVGEGGLPVGILPDAEFEAVRMTLTAGARLYLCSDGVPDCLNPQGERFGQARLERVLMDNRERSLPELRRAVRDALYDWRGGAPIADDISFLAIEHA